MEDAPHIHISSTRMVFIAMLLLLSNEIFMCLSRLTKFDNVCHNTLLLLFVICERLLDGLEQKNNNKILTFANSMRGKKDLNDVTSFTLIKDVLDLLLKIYIEKRKFLYK